MSAITPDTKLLVNATISAAIAGAIAGAIATGFVTSWLDRRRDRAKRLHDRRVRHYNALITLQWQLDEARAILEDNQIALKELVDMGKKGLLTPKRPQLLRVDYSSVEVIADNTLMNMIGQYNYRARRLNLDSENLTHAINQLESMMLSRQLSQKDYAAHVTVFEAGIEALKNGMKEVLDDQVMDVIAYVRICSDKDASKEMRDQGRKALGGRGPIPPGDIVKVKKIILRELADSEAEDIKKRNLKKT
jgi:hypothetical protein